MIRQGSHTKNGPLVRVARGEKWLVNDYAGIKRMERA